MTPTKHFSTQNLESRISMFSLKFFLSYSNSPLCTCLKRCYFFLIEKLTSFVGCFMQKYLHKVIHIWKRGNKLPAAFSPLGFNMQTKVVFQKSDNLETNLSCQFFSSPLVLMTLLFQFILDTNYKWIKGILVYHFLIISNDNILIFLKSPRKNRIEKSPDEIYVFLTR